MNLDTSSKCHICSNKINPKRSLECSTNVCTECRKKDLYLSKTACKKDYYLDEDELDTLFHFTINSHTYGKKMVITLYVKDEVINFVNKKYINFEKYKEKREEKKDRTSYLRTMKQHNDKQKRIKLVNNFFGNENEIIDETINLFIEGGYKKIKSEIKKMQKMKYRHNDMYNEHNACCVSNIENDNELKQYVDDLIEKNKNKKKRKTELNDILEKNGLILRDDSKICQAYINGGIDDVHEINPKFNNLDDIIIELKEMKFYHEKTDYKKKLQSLINDRNNMKSDESIYDLTREAKTKALKEYVKTHKNMRDVPESLIKKIKL